MTHPFNAILFRTFNATLAKTSAPELTIEDLSGPLNVRRINELSVAWAKPQHESSVFNALKLVLSETRDPLWLTTITAIIGHNPELFRQSKRIASVAAKLKAAAV